jgi:hypothetical protein
MSTGCLASSRAVSITCAFDSTPQGPAIRMGAPSFFGLKGAALLTDNPIKTFPNYTVNGRTAERLDARQMGE